jgi:hypothetical protein
MRGRSHVVAAFAAVFACACGTGDTRVDPSDLELRDLLGVSPEAAGAWDPGQREAARRVLVEALDHGSELVTTELVTASAVDDQVTRSLATLDTQRFAAGDGALGLVRMTIAGSELTGATREAPTVTATAAGDAGPVVKLQLSERWGTVPARSREVLAALAIDSGHTGDTLVVVPAPRLTVIASYVATTPPHLVVNPVLLAAIDPAADALVTASAPSVATARRTGTDPSAIHPAEPTAIAGNPYSFYGSVAECAAAQRTRCESCLPAGNCEPVTTSDGATECTRLGEADGRGYYLLCINLALAITSIQDCAADSASGCARDTDAASSLSQLEANANFLDDSNCGGALDACLTEVFGSPDGGFPSLVDGGVEPVTDPPRSTEVNCGDACNSENNNCEFSPNCDCSGPSCGNSFSCDSSCSDSNSQSGCGDNCDSCSSSSGGSSGGGGGGCSSSSGGTSSGGDCGGGDCGGGDCGGGSCGGGGGGGGGCGGSGGGCQVAKKPPSAVFAVALSLSWALLPVPVAAMLRRRSRRKKSARRAATGSDAEPTASDAESVKEVSP